MSDWQPIEVYDALSAQKRPRRAVFFFSAVVSERRPEASLIATVGTCRVMGNRTCTHFVALPADPH